MSEVDDILREQISPISRRALTVPHEFLRREREARQERRRLLADPEPPTGFDVLLPIGPFLPFDRALRQEAEPLCEGSGRECVL